MTPAALVFLIPFIIGSHYLCISGLREVLPKRRRTALRNAATNPSPARRDDRP
jgi:hypothetical protein